MGVGRGLSAWSTSLCSTARSTGFYFASLASIADNAPPTAYCMPSPSRRHNARTLRGLSAYGVSFLWVAVQRAKPERPSRRGMLGTITGGGTRDRVGRKGHGPNAL